MAKKTAKLIQRMPSGLSGNDARLYRLSEPLNGTDFVYVSTVVALGTPETYIFAADESGTVIKWRELPGSFRGELNHNKALKNAGYRVTK